MLPLVKKIKLSEGGNKQKVTSVPKAENTSLGTKGNEVNLGVKTDTEAGLTDWEEHINQRVIEKSKTKSINVLPAEDVYRHLVLGQNVESLNFENKSMKTRNYVAVEVDIKSTSPPLFDKTQKRNTANLGDTQTFHSSSIDSVNEIGSKEHMTLHNSKGNSSSAFNSTSNNSLDPSSSKKCHDKIVNENLAPVIATVKSIPNSRKEESNQSISCAINEKDAKLTEIQPQAQLQTLLTNVNKVFLPTNQLQKMCSTPLNTYFIITKSSLAQKVGTNAPLIRFKSISNSGKEKSNQSISCTKNQKDMKLTEIQPQTKLETLVTNVNKVLLPKSQLQKICSTPLNTHYILTKGPLAQTQEGGTNAPLIRCVKIPMQKTNQVVLLDMKTVSKSGDSAKTNSTCGPSIAKVAKSVPTTSKPSGNEMWNAENINHFFDGLLDDDDEGCAEDLGLNSVGELKEFWELLAELYSYNKQLLNSLRKKKSRYVNNIRRLENRLQSEFGFKLENSSGKNMEEPDIPETVTDN